MKRLISSLHKQLYQPSKHASFTEKGMTLIELTVVLLILTTLATVALRSTTGLVEQARWEQTKKRYEEIKKAIIGDPNLIINDQPDISGFVADMGRLPNNIHELLEEDFCLTDRTIPDQLTCTTANWTNQPTWTPPTSTTLGNGWNGPYLTTSENSADTDTYTDGWGRLAQNNADQNYGWNFVLAAPNLILQSFGKDQAAGGAGEYDTDYPPNALVIPAINQDDWNTDLNGGLSIVMQIPLNFPKCDITNLPTQTACEAAGQTWVASACTVLNASPPCNKSWMEFNSTLNTCSSKSKAYCDNYIAPVTLNTQIIDLVITYRDGLGGTLTNVSSATVIENGQVQNISFPIAANIPLGTNRLFIQKTGTTDIYPPSCIGLNGDAGGNTVPDCVDAGGTLLANGLCDDITVAECMTGADGGTGTVIRNTKKITFIPHQTMSNINW